jgi:hypothetical protein
MELDGGNMKLYLVTVRLQRHPDHDPRNKVAGECPLSSGECTDVTGEHHTMLLGSNETASEIHVRLAKQFHVTRVEQVPPGNYLGRLAD